MVFATGDDLRARWSRAPAGAQADAVLEDASVWLSATFAIPEPPSDKLAAVLKLITCAMAKRALLAENTEHVQQLTNTAGPFSQGATFRNSEGNLYLTGAEREMLEKVLADDRGSSGGMITVEAEAW